MGDVLAGEPNGEYLPPPGIVYWEADPRQRGDLASLLESSPDLSQDYLQQNGFPRWIWNSVPRDRIRIRHVRRLPGLTGGAGGYAQMYGPRQMVDPYGRPNSNPARAWAIPWLTNFLLRLSFRAPSGCSLPAEKRWDMLPTRWMKKEMWWFIGKCSRQCADPSLRLGEDPR